MNTSLLPLATLTLISAIAAVIDVRTRRIPNGLILCGLLGGALVNLAARVLAQGASFGDALTRGGLSVALGILVCAIVPLVLFRIGAMGGGDVKLLAVAGACAGPLAGMQIQVAAFVVGAGFAILELAVRGQLGRMLKNSLTLLANVFLPPSRRRPLNGVLLTSLPFGPAIFASVVLVTFSAELGL